MKKMALIAAVSAMALAGCTTTNPYTGESQTSRTAIGAGIGAGVGAILGAATNTSSSEQARKNALIGAGVGALIGGGVDTTTSQTALTLLHLGTHPDIRQQLIDHPELYRTATDEFLRYFSVNQQLSRTVTRDVTVGGQRLRKNDRVIISWLAANHDEQEHLVELLDGRGEDSLVLGRRPVAGEGVAQRRKQRATARQLRLHLVVEYPSTHDGRRFKN